MRSFVVCLDDSLEPFLACSVPDLQFDLLIVNFVVAYLEINSDRRHEIVSERVISVSH